jgi:hypothetical protein
MTDPVAGNSRSLPCAASIYAAAGAPSLPELDAMWLAAPTRPPLSEYERWVAEGNDPQHAAECRAFECSRSRLMASIYGEAA